MLKCRSVGFCADPSAFFSVVMIFRSWMLSNAVKEQWEYFGVSGFVEVLDVVVL
jgi:hypothetical protein